jgi:hypothetical protein
MRPYDEPAYRAARAQLRSGLACWRGCGNQATTIDHVPALAAHHHQPGSDCCALLPACAQCNYAGGARIANRRRSGRRPYTSRRW